MVLMHKGMKIFSYPKVIFIAPTMVVALICGLVMFFKGDPTHDPKKIQHPAAATAKTAPATASSPAAEEATAHAAEVRRFFSTQNMVGVVFLTVFALNILIMAIDFPRFTVIVIILFIAALGFALLWVSEYIPLLKPLTEFLERVFVVANAQFYFLFATVILVNLAIIWVTRYLDYWEILPNEILHNHGPWSEVGRYPTMNMSFQKEIPDILEYALLRSGRLVLHVQGERKAIVLENVLGIDRKEEELKRLMSRMEVRVTTDQEAAEPI
jgi:hypothetical protein